jgi:hypothetical protein
VNRLLQQFVGTFSHQGSLELRLSGRKVDVLTALQRGLTNARIVARIEDLGTDSRGLRRAGLAQDRPNVPI